MNYKRRMLFTMIISVLTVLMNCGISLLLTPYITNYVGAEAYGFVSLAKNFVNFSNIFMAALNTYASRFITVAYLNRKENEFNEYFSTVFIADLILGGILCFIGIFCIYNLENLLNISQKFVTDVKLLFLFTFLAFFLTTVSTVYLSSSFVKDKLYLQNTIKMISYIVEILILLFCFILFDSHIWYVGLGSLGMAVVILVGNRKITKKYLPEAKISLDNFSYSMVYKLVTNGIWNSANSLGNQLNSGLDLLISNLLLDGIVMGQISISKTITQIVYSLYNVIAQPFYPIFLKDYSLNDKSLIYHFKQSMRICGLITNIIFAGFIAVGVQFYQLWIPTQEIRYVYILTILALIPSVTEGCIYPLYYSYTLTLKNKFPCLVTILGGFLNIISMYLLLKYTELGAYSVLLTTAVIMSFINLITNPIYISKCLNVKKTEFYGVLITNVISCFIISVILSFCSAIMPISLTWRNIIIKIIILGILGICIQIPIIFGIDSFSRYIKDIQQNIKIFIRNLF